MDFEQASKELEKASYALTIDERLAAYTIFERLAERGVEQAMFMTGYLLHVDSDGGVEQDFVKARYWYEKHYEITGDGLCALHLAKLYFEGDGVDIDFTKAMSILEPHSADTDARVNMLLGRLMASKEIARVEDALEQFEIAYEKGNVFCLRDKGLLLIRNGHLWLGLVTLLKCLKEVFAAVDAGKEEELWPS